MSRPSLFEADNDPGEYDDLRDGNLVFLFTVSSFACIFTMQVFLALHTAYEYRTALVIVFSVGDKMCLVCGTSLWNKPQLHRTTGKTPPWPWEILRYHSIRSDNVLT